MNNIQRSLSDLLGACYIGAVKRCAVELHAIEPETAGRLAETRVEFFSQEFEDRQHALLPRAGKQILEPFHNDNCGAPTQAFANATNRNAAPVGGTGVFRLGEDGRLYITAKSEHYHTPLGHNFGGYRLLTWARELGILNATHNNTRGYITRLMERELIRVVNGLQKGDEQALRTVLASAAPGVLNRVINLETGSLAVEAGIKMMLNRFYRMDRAASDPVFRGKTPVLLVMADHNGGTEANYHGTTILAQTLRGMWPEFYDAAEKNELYKVVGVRINDVDDFAQKINQYNSGQYRTAGFLHEIILMNYGGIRLGPEYLSAAYDLCRLHHTPVLVDEIQSCMWYKGMLLYRLYGLTPDFVVLGKGFPGGEYPASKIITTGEMDSLSLFGALVTNGQEELASLAYLITMEFTQANGEEIERLGGIFEQRLRQVAGASPDLVARIEGLGHLAAIHFRSLDAAVEFAKRMNRSCIDVSAQTYKANCPPAVLLKPPVIATEKVLHAIADRIADVITAMREEGTWGA